MFKNNVAQCLLFLSAICCSNPSFTVDQIKSGPVAEPKNNWVELPSGIAKAFKDLSSKVQKDAVYSKAYSVLNRFTEKNKGKAPFHIVLFATESALRAIKSQKDYSKDADLKKLDQAFGDYKKQLLASKLVQRAVSANASDTRPCRRSCSRDCNRPCRRSCSRDCNRPCKRSCSRDCRTNCSCDNNCPSCPKR